MSWQIHRPGLQQGERSCERSTPHEPWRGFMASEPASRTCSRTATTRSCVSAACRWSPRSATRPGVYMDRRRWRPSSRSHATSSGRWRRSQAPAPSCPRRCTTTRSTRSHSGAITRTIGGSSRSVTGRAGAQEVHQALDSNRGPVPFFLDRQVKRAAGVLAHPRALSSLPPAERAFLTCEHSRLSAQLLRRRRCRSSRLPAGPVTRHRCTCTTERTRPFGSSTAT